jgi:hypothetical protein
MRPVELLIEACERALPLLRSRELGEQWTQPSALPLWSNAGLAGHLARAAFNLQRAHVPPRHVGQVLDAVTYYANAAPEPPDSPVGRRIRELGEQEAVAGQPELADRFAACISVLRTDVAATPVGTLVDMFGRVLPIDECATACLLELVVHTDDLR